MPSAIRLSFDPGDEVVDQHPDPSARAGPELAQVGGEVVDAAEVLHDHALDPQVVAPHLLDQLGVVPALDVDPALPGHPGLAPATATDRTPYAWRPAEPLRTGRGQDHRPPLEQEARAEREGTAPVAAVLQGDRVQVPVDGHDLAAEVGHDLLDDLAELRGGRSTARPRFGARQSVERTSEP